MNGGFPGGPAGPGGAGGCCPWVLNMVVFGGVGKTGVVVMTCSWLPECKAGLLSLGGACLSYRGCGIEYA